MWDVGQGASPWAARRRTGTDREIIATVASWVFAGAVSFVLLKILDATMGLRVSEEQEMEGLDVSLHEEEGYIFG